MLPASAVSNDGPRKHASYAGSPAEAPPSLRLPYQEALIIQASFSTLQADCRSIAARNERVCLTMYVFRTKNHRTNKSLVLDLRIAKMGRHASCRRARLSSRAVKAREHRSPSPCERPPEFECASDNVTSVTARMLPSGFYS